MNTNVYEIIEDARRRELSRAFSLKRTINCAIRQAKENAGDYPDDNGVDILVFLLSLRSLNNLDFELLSDALGTHIKHLESSAMKFDKGELQ